MIQDLMKAILAGKKTKHGFLAEIPDKLVKQLRLQLEREEADRTAELYRHQMSQAGHSRDIQEQIDHAKQHGLVPPEVIPDMVLRCRSCHAEYGDGRFCGCKARPGEPFGYAAPAEAL